MKYVKTVLGEVDACTLGITLAHEHICCYSEYLYKMSGKGYLDKERLVETAVIYLKQLKKAYGLHTFVDCTPINIGRDTELLKSVSEQAEMNLLCATGFYYNEEPILANTSEKQLCTHMMRDTKSVNAGIIKCGVEHEEMGTFQEKILRACAKVHSYTGLPLVVHTNAKKQNALKALEILLSEGVTAEAITVSHLSDTEDLEYIKRIAGYGCFIGLDRLYGNLTEAYISKKIQSILELCKAGYENQIVLSHDALFFNGFESEPMINEKPRYAYCFDHILPKLPVEMSESIMVHNPMRLLTCS